MGWSGWTPSSLLHMRPRSMSPGWSRWTSSRRTPAQPLLVHLGTGLNAPFPCHQELKGTQFIHRHSSVRGATAGLSVGIKDCSRARYADGRAGGRLGALGRPFPLGIAGGEWNRPRGGYPRTGTWKKRESESSGADSASCTEDEQRWKRSTRSTEPPTLVP